MATTVLGLKTFTASDPVDYNEINDNYNKIDNGVKTALQGRAAHNWLGNSNFRIAQAGYGGMHGTQKYACDRWYDTYGYGSFSFDESQGLTIAYGTNHAYLVQKIDGASLLHGKYVTLACQLSDGTVYVNSGVFNSSGTSFQIVVDSGKTFTLYYDRAEFVVTSGSMTIKWAALYEGSYTADTLPAYQPKGYSAELAECMRYFERIGSAESIKLGNNIYVGSGAKAFVFSIKYAPKRLKSPSVTFSDVSNYRVLFQDAVNASVYGASGITAIDDIMAESPYAQFRVSISSAIDTNSWAVLQRQDGAQNAYIDISADL